MLKILFVFFLAQTSNLAFALHISIKNDDEALFLSLIVMAGLDKVNQIDEMGKTPLHIAAEKGNCQAMECLLEAGANVNIYDFSQKKAFDLALENKQYEAAIKVFMANQPSEPERLKFFNFLASINRLDLLDKYKIKFQSVAFIVPPILLSSTSLQNVEYCNDLFLKNFEEKFFAENNFPHVEVSGLDLELSFGRWQSAKNLITLGATVSHQTQGSLCKGFELNQRLEEFDIFISLLADLISIGLKPDILKDIGNELTLRAASIDHLETLELLRRHGYAHLAYTDAAEYNPNRIPLALLVSFNKKHFLFASKILNLLPETKSNDFFQNPPMILILLQSYNNNEDIYLINDALKSGHLNFPKTDANGVTPLHYFASIEPGAVGFWVLIKLFEGLLKVDSFLNTPFHIAVFNVQVRKIRLTFKHVLTTSRYNDMQKMQLLNKILNSKNNAGLTPIHYLADLENEEVIDLLTSLSKNYTIFAMMLYEAFKTKDNQGNTVFHRTMTQGNFEKITPFLIKLYTSVYLKTSDAQKQQAYNPLLDVDNDGQTPLHLLAMQKLDSANIISLLLENNANPRLINKNGKTPWDLIKENNHCTCISQIIWAMINSTHSHYGGN